MAELVTVYEARPNEVARIVGLLESRHLHPVVGDDADRMTAYREQSHLIRIAVPAVERDRALGVLADVEHHDAARLSHLITTTNRAVLFVLIGSDLGCSVWGGRRRADPLGLDPQAPGLKPHSFFRSPAPPRIRRSNGPPSPSDEANWLRFSSPPSFSAPKSGKLASFGAIDDTATARPRPVI